VTAAHDVARRPPLRSRGWRVLMVAPTAALAVAVVVAALGVYVESSVGRNDERTFAHVFHQPGATLSPARLARSSITWSGGPTTASTGESVNVFVSASLSPELGTSQTWADFIAGLLHGPELSSLTAYIATFAEMQEVCGEDALGCYGANELVSMGETMFGVTAAEVIRHEYGHHIAFHRLNAPWQAIDWGPKNWASSMDVCRRAKDGTAYPGDEGHNYSRNPGEAWAETYRLLDERKAGVTSSGWPIVDASFYPDEAAFQAAERDVLQPWGFPRATVYKNRFTSKGKPMWTVPLTTPLDGSAEITVSLPKGGLHEVALVDVARKKVLAVGLWAGRSVKKIATNVCGYRALVLRVTQRGAFGRVRVIALVP
jgi:hypothetical protein